MRLIWTVLVLGASIGSAQTPHTTVRHHREAVADDGSAQLIQAQTAIENRDFAGAVELLQKYTTAKPDDYRGWYTLGYANSELNSADAAISDYKKALAIKPDLFEANFDLGSLLARSGRRDEAIALLEKATTETPSAGDAAQQKRAKASAWTAVGALRSGDAAKQAYEQALALDAENEEARRGLAISTSCPPGQIKTVTKTASQTSDVAGCIPATTETLAQHNAANPGDTAAASLLAHQYIESKDYAKAEPLMKQVVAANPRDANSHFRYGVVLEHLLRNTEAEEELLKAVQLDPKLADAYGDLAIVAANNKKYALSMKALEFRGKYLPENSGTYFLRATNLDHLQQVKPAAMMYRKYLDVSKGESPDNDWKAKHRLIALDPHNATKGKEN
ncbi:MAG: hypothetical protein NVS9B15_00820 [Acidobacteriaceae bacterium]